jgi:hypothetical protein
MQKGVCITLLSHFVTAISGFDGLKICKTEFSIFQTNIYFASSVDNRLSSSEMQIPGLNLLSGRTSTDPSNEVGSLEQNNAPTLPVDANEVSSSKLPPSDLLSDPPNGESINLVSPAVEEVKDPLEHEVISATNSAEDGPDPLDLALEEPSDPSSTSSIHGEENESEDEGRYSFPN